MDIDRLKKLTFPTQNDESVQFIRHKISEVDEKPGVYVDYWNKNESDKIIGYKSYIECFDESLKYILENKEAVQINYDDSLLDVLLKSSNKIAWETRRGAGNVIICSSNTAKKIIEEHNLTSSYPVDKYDVCVGRYNIVRHSLPDNKVIVMYRGPMDVDSGIIFHEDTGMFYSILDKQNTLSYYQVLELKDA